MSDPKVWKVESRTSTHLFYLTIETNDRVRRAIVTGVPSDDGISDVGMSRREVIDRLACKLEAMADLLRKES